MITTQHLREQPADFLVCSVLKEVLERTNAKVEGIRQITTKRTNALSPVALTRSQALAVAYSIDVDAEFCSLPELSMQEPGSFEAGFLVHQLSIPGDAIDTNRVSWSSWLPTSFQYPEVRLRLIIQ